jgi:hypothetical protein
MKGRDMSFDLFFPTAQPDSGRVEMAHRHVAEHTTPGSGIMLSLPGDQS